MTRTTQDTTGTHATPDETRAARADAADALHRLVDAVRTLDDAALRSPSALDGWTVGHVLSHVAMVGDALARQAELASRGETAEVYEGGAEGRAAGIEDGATCSRDEHLAALSAAGARLDAAWDLTDRTRWDAPVTYRDGTVADVLDCWWREVRIHATDLGAVSTAQGLTPTATWGLAFTDHLLDFLGLRLSAPVLVVRDEDGARSVVGPDGVQAAPPRADDALTTVTGSAAEVAAWLAGRETATTPAAHRDSRTVELPPLAPWPSGVPVRRREPVRP
ncbi:maleylpyruvate isomerase family mycothiol-dependent enzyme [Oerskovia sp. NPDC057915]|uniref:maleylpyruvate isomerase family mycothiol-dependent enzyme n=1 Tax=Oerskovia sp. NPDC057915 TaxID=3346280 RepID=UPI0036D8B763